MPNQAYRLRIRSADDLSDTLVLTSIRGGTNPYIAAPPSGDGQEVDLLTGAVRTGAYVVEVVDAVTGSDAIGTIRVVTNKLYDGIEEYLLLENGDKILLESGDPIELEQNNAEFGRPHLLSRKAYVEMSSDGGSTWSVWIAGYLTSVRQTDAIRYAFTVSNSRRVEQTKQVFTWQTAAERTAFPKRGCIFGGPVIEGLGGGTTRTVDSGGWEFLYRATTGSSASPIEGDTLALKYDFGYFPPFYERKAVPGPDQTAQFWNNLLPFMQPVPIDSAASGADFAALRGDDGPIYGASDILCIVTNPATGDEWLGSLRGIDIDGQAADNNNRRTFVYKRNIFVTLYRSETSWPALPAQGTTLRVRGVTRQVSEASPLYLQAHPVDIAAALYTQANLSVNSASVTSVKALVGSTMWLTARITQAQTMADFLETALYGPFGFSARTNASGEMEFFSTRALTSNAPTETINNASIVGDTPPTIFDLDESTVVTGFTITQVALNVATATDTPFTQRPADNVFSTTQPVEYLSGDTTTYSTRVVNYDIPGMVTDSESFVPTFQELARGIALEGFDRFGRGAPSGEVHVLRTASVASANIGDFVYVDASYYPNKNYRIGESSVGPRVAQIVRREERPEGPVFKFVDAGPFVQPALAPTITIAVSSTDARRVAAFTITNAAAIANSADISVAVEYGTGSTQPSGGITFTRYTAAQLPTGAVDLPAVKPGSRVWVRARTEQAGIFPSAWSAWADVTLTAWAAPTGVTVGTLTNQTAAVSWSLNGNTSDPVDVYVAPGSVAPSSWTKYRVNTLPPNTTATTITGLLGSTAYIVGIAFRDMVSNVAQTPLTATFTTAASATATCSRPAGVQIIKGVPDVSLNQGIVLALWASVEVLQAQSFIVIERATSSGGSFTELAVVPSTQPVYVDYLPDTNTTYYYRLKHRMDGYNDSSATPEVSAVARGVLPIVARPDAVMPVVVVTTSESGATATVTVAMTDPQSRVTQVRFRDRTNNGSWSAWTIDSSVPYSYSATIPTTGFVEIEYEVTGYNAAGSSGVLAAGVESFDADTNATIVTAAGTFSLAGALTLSVQGDTDTNSFKYAVATTNWVDDAAAYTAAQAGTLVNARNGVITLAGPYAVGSVVYVAIAGYTGASGAGTVSGPYRYAFLNGSKDTLYTMCQAVQSAASATSISVTVSATAPNGTPQVRLVAIAGTATRTAGATPGTLVASGSSWTFSRGAFDSGPSQVQFEAVLAGAETDADFIEIPEQGRDTVPLLTRARVTATSASSVTVRVAVADPYPQGANSVSLAYVTLGLATVTPSSPQLITPDSTLTEAANTYVDFTVPRPAAGAGMGRITFTASASGRVSDADAVDVPPSILVYSLCEATQTNATDTAIEVTVTASADNGTPEVRYTGLDGTATKFSGPNLNVLSPSGTTWVFTRGAFNSGPSQASFESVLSGAVTDIDFITIPEQQRDTVPLIARARVTAVDANNVTVRVAVADPYPQGTNSATIALSTTGLGTITQTNGSALPSPIQVTPESTLTENAGTYYDFLVPRPTANSAPGRVTFTATASNRTSDSDATDVVPKNPVPASLTVNYTASDTEYVITWSVGATDTATVSIDGGTFSTPAASPITVARGEYKTGADKVYTFKSTGAMNDVVTSSVTVAKQLPYVNNPPTVDVTGVTKDSSTAATVSWTFADIPTGATWTVSGRAFDVGSGTVTNTGIALGTSPKTRQLTGFTGMGTGTLFRATVTAKDSGGSTIASDTLDVTF